MDGWMDGLHGFDGLDWTDVLNVWMDR